MTKRIAETVVIVVTLVCSCGLPRLATAMHHEAGDSTAVAQPQKGQIWQLVEVQERRVPQTAEVTTLSINIEAGTIGGHTGCNRYWGRIEVRTEGSGSGVVGIRLRDVEHGDVACPEQRTIAEQRYLQLLRRADAVRVDGYTMTLERNGKTILKYELQ